MIHFNRFQVAKTVLEIMEDVHDLYTCGDFGGEYEDIRLISGETQGDCEVVSGDPSYDLWHGVACGAASFAVTDPPTQKEAEEIATDLIEQVLERLVEGG